MKNKYASISKKLFYALIIVFILLVCYFAAPFPNQSKRFLFPTVAVLVAIFFLLGAALMVFTIKANPEKKQKLFFLFTGGVAAGFLLSILLHNFIYGLLIFLFGERIWETLSVPGEPFFFFVAFIVCPLLFLIGVIGTLVLFSKKKHHAKRNKK